MELLDLLQDQLGPRGPNAVDVAQRILDALLAGNVNTHQTWHGMCGSLVELALPLLVAGVRADDADDAAATHNHAVLADSFD